MAGALLVWTAFHVMGMPEGNGFLLLLLLTLGALFYAAWRCANFPSQTLQSTEDLLREAIEGLPHGFELYDAEDRLVMCNQEAIRKQSTIEGIFQPGATFESTIRAAAMDGRVPEAIGRVEEWIAERMVQHRNPPNAIEQKFSDGQWYLINESRTRSGGIVYVRTDITEQKLTEEALNDLQALSIKAQELARIGYSVWNPVEGCAIYMSPVMKEIFGLAPEDPLDDLATFMARIHPNDRERYTRESVKCLESGELFDMEYRIVLADGETRHLHVKSETEYDENDHPVRRVGVIQDVTESTLAEMAIVTTKRRMKSMVSPKSAKSC